MWCPFVRVCVGLQQTLEQIDADHSCRACWTDKVTGQSPCNDNSLDGETSLNGETIVQMARQQLRRRDNSLEWDNSLDGETIV